jgi:hypothetical protein
MANRETYPAAQSPLQGDISGPAGASTVTVVGLQTVPVSDATPTPEDALRFHSATGEWEPTADGNVSVTLGTYETAGGVVTGKGVNISDDYAFSVNGVAIDGLVGWPYGDGEVYVNGVQIA